MEARKTKVSRKRVAQVPPELAPLRGIAIPDVAAAAGIAVCSLWRLRKAGKFPNPDLRAGRREMYSPGTAQAGLKGLRVRS